MIRGGFCLFCLFCGAENDNSAKFCCFCDNSLVDNSVMNMSFLTPQIEQKLNKTDEKYIFQCGNLFLIINEFNGFKIIFDILLSLEDAIFKKNDLVARGWPISKILFDELGTVFTDNIMEKDGKFIVFNYYNNNLNIFGEFSSKKDAIKLKYDLIETGWDINKIKASKYGTYIYLTNRNIFAIIKYINGKHRSFGYFKNLEDAKLAKNILINLNWDLSKINLDNCIFKMDTNLFILLFPVDGKIKILEKFSSFDEAFKFKSKVPDKIDALNQINKSKYGEYIYRAQSGSFFISKFVAGKQRNYGHFKNLDDARFVKSILVDLNWDLTKINKYNCIFKTKDGLNIILGIVEGNVKILGKFHTFHDAYEFKNLFDFEKLGDGKRKTIKKDRYIFKKNSKFYILKRIDGKLKEFGVFDSRKDAIASRDRLISNNWEIEMDSVENEVTLVVNHVYFDGDYYFIKNIVEGEERIYGVYKNKDVAIKDKTTFVMENWNVPYAIRTEEYPYGENIVPFDYIFILEDIINNQRVELGTYYSFKDVVDAKKELIDNH